MPTIYPFKAVRPTKETASQIAALPYDVFNRSEAKKEIEDKPLSFLRVDRAETTLPDTVDTYDHQVYLKAKENYHNLKKQGYLISDDTPSFYLYELKTSDHTQTGIVSTCDVADYLNHKIKENEATRKDKERDRINHISTLNAHTGPIYLTYKHSDSIKELTEELKKTEPVFSFTSEDGVTHTGWKIDSPEYILQLTQAFSDVDSFYIADGHHRSVSAVKVAQQRGIGDNEVSRFLAVIFPDNELNILDYNRVVKDLNGLSPDEFLKLLDQNFMITPEEEQVRPSQKAEFGLYLNGKWYRLKYKYDLPENIVDQLDVSILYDKILKPILAIGNPRIDKRINFVGGIRGLKELERLVDTGEVALAFSMFPTKMEELIAIADNNELMPPKTTWFEPKLRSGLFIHEF